MKKVHLLYTLLFGVAVVLFFGWGYPHHLHYQEQFQLFLFDGSYVLGIVKQPGGVADLLGRFCTQFFLYAWVGALIIGVLLALVQWLTLKVTGGGRLEALSSVPAFLLWLFLLDENALLGGVWAVLITLLVAWGCLSLFRGWLRYVMLIVAVPLLYWVAGPVCLPIPVDSLWHGVHYYRYPSEFPTQLWLAALSVFVLTILGRGLHKWTGGSNSPVVTLLSWVLVVLVMGNLVSKHANFKAERVMQYDFMARYQQWNRILETVNKEKPNNQIGVTVQNLALAMHGMLTQHLFEYHQNGIAGLLPDMMTDAVSPLPTAEAFYQLGMITVAQRTVFEAQEAILDFQKSGRCYQRLAQTYLIIGNYDVSRKYLMALQKTLFYRSWANETLPLLGDEEAIAKHPEYGRLRRMTYQDDFYFGGHITADMLERLYESNPDNRLAYEYLVAYYMLTGDREGYTRFLHKMNKQ